MDSINITDKQTADTLNHQQPLIKPYQRHGRTTSIDDHSDLQVLKRIKRYLLPKDFVISQDLLNEMVAGYDIGDSLADSIGH